MKVSKLVGLRFKEKPADCVIDSHALMVRGGYIKYVGNGIYSEFPTLKKITSKIEAIIRKEIGTLPVILANNVFKGIVEMTTSASSNTRFPFDFI